MIKILGSLLAICCFHLQAISSPVDGERFEVKVKPTKEVVAENSKVNIHTSNSVSLENAYPFYNESFEYEATTDTEPDMLSIENSMEFAGSVVAMIILLSGIRFSFKR